MRPPVAVPVLFACENVTVTATELTVGPKVYVVRHLTSVRLGEASWHYDVAARPWPFAGFVLGLFFAAGAFMETMHHRGSPANLVLGVLGAAAALVSALVGGRGVRVYPVYLRSAGGPEERVLFRDQATAEGALEAVRRAMAG